MKKHNVKNSVYKICAFLLLAFFSFRATVQPFFPGENLWKLVSRIGLTSDIIEEKVCDLACDTSIKQDDIPFTITAPGVYCLSENVNFTTGSAVTIKSNCVVFDLLGHAIEGASGSGNGILIDVLNTFTANVTVKNGIIKGAGGDGIKVDMTGQVKISNMKITDCTGEGIDISSNSQRVIVEDCISSSNNSVGFLVDGDFCTLRNCTSYRDSAGFVILGGDNNCLINCKASESVGSGFGVDDNCTLKCCIAQECGEVGFSIVGNQNFFSQCIAQKNVSEGFNIAKDKNTFCKCAAIGNGNNGFSVIGDGNIFRKCTATSNAGSGFFLDQESDNNQIIGCSSVCNGKFGIENNGFGTIIRKCSATSNTKSGFNLFNDNNQIIGCSLVCNGEFGIRNAGSGNIIHNNVANNNSSGNYSAVDLVETMITVTTSFWVNVSG